MKVTGYFGVKKKKKYLRLLRVPNIAIERDHSHFTNTRILPC